MGDNKRFKLKLSRLNIPSFHFCRLKSPSSFPENPKPAKYRSSDGCDYSRSDDRKSSDLFGVVNEDDDSLVLLDSSRSFLKKQKEKKKIEKAKKVRESVAVVKKSDDPYEDFKRSMWEMITEKKIYGVAELEELLHFFLRLNSRQFHGVIIEAFSDIWKILFSEKKYI